MNNSCRAVQTDKGNIARVNGKPPSTPEGRRALSNLIDAATEDMKRRNPENPTNQDKN